MAKKKPQLDTPFRTGEKVITTRPMPGTEIGTRGKVRLVNGIGPWMRYWVRFSDGSIGRQIDHDDLVRPNQLDEWTANQERLEALAQAGEEAAASAASETATATGDGDAANLIPAALLERSKAAKARLLGG